MCTTRVNLKTRLREINGTNIFVIVDTIILHNIPKSLPFKNKKKRKKEKLIHLPLCPNYLILFE